MTDPTEVPVPADANDLAAALAAAVNAAARKRPRPDPTQGARSTPASGQLGQADLAGMRPEEITAALKAGRLSDLLAGRDNNN